MPKTRIPHTNFTSGELDPDMEARPDVAQYQHGAASLRNYRLKMHGGVTRRPGSSYKSTLVDVPMMAPFLFNNNQKNIFVFTHGRLDVYDSAGLLVQTHTGQRWTAGILGDLRYVQAFDTFFLTHEDIHTQIITRTAADTFSIANFAFEQHSSGQPMYQPYIKYADPAMTMTPSGTADSITLTLSGDHFVLAHVGAIFRYQKKEIEITAYHTPTTATGSVRNPLPDTDASADWDEPQYSVAKGYPRVVELHEQRLWFLGDKQRPSSVNASKIGAFFNFDLGTGLDNEAIQEGLTERQVNKIVSALSSSDLHIFTDRGEFYLPTKKDFPITPSNVSFPKISPYGSGAVRPVDFDGGAIFIQATGKTIRELVINSTSTKYDIFGLNLLASHILNAPVDMDVLYGQTDISAQYAYLVNGDGTMAVCHSIRKQQVLGWTPWDTDGKVKAVCVLDTDVFIAVERIINSETVIYLELMDNNLALDAGISLTSASDTKVWTGLTHLEGKNVAVNSGNLHLGKFIVTSGQLTTNDNATAVEIGLDFTTEIKSMPPETLSSTANTASIAGFMKRVVRIFIRFDETYALSINGKKMILRKVKDDPGLAPTPATEWHEFYLRGYDRDGQVTLTQDAPLKATVLAFSTEIEVNP